MVEMARCATDDASSLFPHLAGEESNDGLI